MSITLADQEGDFEGRNGWALPVKDKAAFAAKLREVFATLVESLRETDRLSKRMRFENAMRILLVVETLWA